MKKSHKIMGLITLFSLVFCLFAGCEEKNDAVSEEPAGHDQNQSLSQLLESTVSWRDYNGKKIGVLVGPLMEDAAKEYFPDSEYLLFNSYPDCITALLTGKIDVSVT